jgi:hypothetical protein
MKKPKTDKLNDVYAKGLMLFEGINPQPPDGMSREVFLGLAMQVMMAREAFKPMADTEREITMRAIVSTIIAEAPASPSEGMLLIQMLINHETIVNCQTRSLDGSQPQIQREKDQAHANKAMGVYLKQMDVRSRLAMRREEGAIAERCGGIAKAIEEGNRRLERDMASRKGNSCKEAEPRAASLPGPPSDRGYVPGDGAQE